ncbi:MAG: hypothetical protein R2822_29950 [Spirosomataceae bacterium]
MNVSFKQSEQRRITGFYPIYTVEQSELDELDIEKISDSYDYALIWVAVDEHECNSLQLIWFLFPLPRKNIDVMASWNIVSH